MKNISEFEPKKYRDFYSMQELVNSIKRSVIVWSWGAQGWTKINNQLLRFKVNGYLHKGYVYVAVNGSDLFDVWTTNLKGEIKDFKTDIYAEDFINIVDKMVETK
jgi:hypothetical protein